jgi:hypothetical protein
MKIKDTRIHKEGRGGSPFSKSQWTEILSENMICCKDFHYYVREGGLAEDYQEAQKGATARLASHWGKGLRERTLEQLENHLEAQKGAAARLADHWDTGQKERTKELLSAVNDTEEVSKIGRDKGCKERNTEILNPLGPGKIEGAGVEPGQTKEPPPKICAEIEVDRIGKISDIKDPSEVRKNEAPGNLSSQPCMSGRPQWGSGKGKREGRRSL